MRSPASILKRLPFRDPSIKGTLMAYGSFLLTGDTEAVARGIEKEPTEIRQILTEALHWIYEATGEILAKLNSNGNL